MSEAAAEKAPEKATPDAAATSDAEAAAAAPAVPRKPFRLRRGTRIELGFRHGVVRDVRGGLKKPYDVLIKWDEEKYPVWVIYSTLERDYEAGSLTVL